MSFNEVLLNRLVGLTTRFRGKACRLVSGIEIRACRPRLHFNKTSKSDPTILTIVQIPSASVEKHTIFDEDAHQDTSGAT